MSTKVSVNDIAKDLNMSAETVKQLCGTGQIPESAYTIYDKGTWVETWLFDRKAVHEALKKSKK